MSAAKLFKMYGQRQHLMMSRCNQGLVSFDTVVNIIIYLSFKIGFQICKG